MLETQAFLCLKKRSRVWTFEFKKNTFVGQNLTLTYTVGGEYTRKNCPSLLCVWLLAYEQDNEWVMLDKVKLITFKVFISMPIKS